MMRVLHLILSLDLKSGAPLQALLSLIKVQVKLLQPALSGFDININF